MSNATPTRADKLNPGDYLPGESATITDITTANDPWEGTSFLYVHLDNGGMLRLDHDVEVEAATSEAR